MKILAWDSHFFGFKVAAITFEHKAQFLREITQDKSVKLCYVFSETVLNSQDLKLVDTKVVFTKKKLQKQDKNTKIISYAETQPSEALIQLSILSGAHSRFKKDSKIPVQKFEELYTLWITNAVNRTFANEVLILKDGLQTAGLVTLHKKEHIAEIGLLSVSENFQRKGYGKQLMKSAENWAFQNGCSQLNVATQKENLTATAFYNSCGYHLLNTTYIYHFWNDKLL